VGLTSKHNGNEVEFIFKNSDENFNQSIKMKLLKNQTDLLLLLLLFILFNTDKPLFGKIWCNHMSSGINLLQKFVINRTEYIKCCNFLTELFRYFRFPFQLRFDYETFEMYSTSLHATMPTS
jgi:hypothetical protein